MSKDIQHLKDLMPDPRNARKHNPRNVGMIETSLQTVGAARSIVIDETGVILAGNATVEAAAAAGIERVQVVDADGETIIAVRRTGLTDEQKKKLALFDNRTAELADWDIDELLASVADGVDLSALFREDELDALLQAAHGQDEEAAKDEPYSRKIETPIYQPSNAKPSVSSLFDDTKTQALISAIQVAEGLTEEQRQFLSIAAQRHTVLHFNKIADYYAHSDERVQRLMEDSALVIIDFNRAIELGFVQLTEKIAEQVKDEYGK